MKTRQQHFNKGYAGLTTLIVTLAVSLTILAALSFFVFRELDINRVYVSSIESRHIAEGGIEDAVYRVISGKQIGASENLIVGGGSTTITRTASGTQTSIRSEGKRNNLQQNLETTLNKITTGVNFVYGVQVDNGGLDMDNNARVTGNVYSNGSITGDPGATITGDAIVAGGVATTSTYAWSANDADNAFATASSNRDIAQSFTATSSDVLNRVSVYLGKVGNPTNNLTLHITADNGGKPETSDLTDEIIPPSYVGLTPGWIDIPLSSPPTLVNGSKYWIVLDYQFSSGTNYWNWRKDTSNGYAGNTGRYANDWNSGGATWVDVGGDLAFRIWVGGVNTRIEDITIGDVATGTARANLFVGTAVHGSNCPNQYCIVENPPRQELPITNSIVQDFKNEAIAGGTITGNYTLTDHASLGPTEITGNLLMTTNNRILTVVGTIYIHGNIDIDNGSTIRCAATYGSNSCIVLSDGWIHVSNNGIFSGSGQPSSYIMLLSTLPCDGTSSAPPCDTGHHNGAIDLHNNALGAIFYASKGLLNIHNGVNIAEATAYKIHIDQTANVTYQSGLADVHFSSGPSGGYNILHWKRVE